MNQFCPWCDSPCTKVEDYYICPKHGKVLVEREKEESEGSPSYIG